MRSFTGVIDGIMALLPSPVPPEEVSAELLVLAAELHILKRTASYAPPEGTHDTELWDRLGTALYRYMPNPSAYPWARAISDLVTGVS